VRFRTKAAFGIALATLFVTGPLRADGGWSSSLSSLAEGAQIFPDLGEFHRGFTSVPKNAQAYFDQGMRLAYGFNHDEATRSFARAAALAPSCAMCFWGVALTLGPNYNAPMLPDRARVTWEALGRAEALAKTASPVEQALITALAKRYTSATSLPPPAQHVNDIAYANAMRDVARRFPKDVDVLVLFAESLMDVRPWKLWTNAGKPAPDTLTLVATIERALMLSPDHPGANHYYIHALEAAHPERATRSADKLAALMPGAGHIQHMPAHIYQRVGRYFDAVLANRRAIAVDKAYLAKTKPPGYYGMYLGHNYGFLAYAASMIGLSAESIDAARAAAEAVPSSMLDMAPGMDFFAAAPTFAQVRFGRWQDLLQAPAPPARYVVLSAIHHHGRGMAQASLGHLDEATSELAALEKLAAGYSADMIAGNINSARNIASIAASAVRGRIAEKRGRSEDAIAAYRAAVAVEDQLGYNEPADWPNPMRHFLGAALLDAGRAQEADTVYVEDLRRNPDNGWSLFGRWQALTKLGRLDDAKKVKAAFDRVWAHADITLARSAF
jgi:tetratricopeptide (TPR) repeat protein